MTTDTLTWDRFLEVIKEQISSIEFENWFAPICFVSFDGTSITLEVPNIFVQDYLLSNYKEELTSFFPKVIFAIAEQKRVAPPQQQKETVPPVEETKSHHVVSLNPLYTFENFIEGPSNQFVKSAALGVAARPGKSYNPLFIHGGVGLGKTHLLHAIGHFVKDSHKRMKIVNITTEGFINEIVDHLKNKSMDKMKRDFRSIDVFLIDDIQFLQNRLNFEDEFCNTFESLINQNKQIVLTSDKPPAQLKLSERLVARMEWGLVAHIAAPDLETRVAILQHKAEQRGFRLPQKIAFFIAEQIYQNVRQLEGALNRLTAYTRLLKTEVTEDIVQKSLSELLQSDSSKKVSIDHVLKSVSALYEVRVSDLKSNCRTKEIAFARQVAMYLAKELINDSLMKLASSFGGKTHSTLLHAWKKISKQLETDEMLKRQIELAKRNLDNPLN